MESIEEGKSARFPRSVRNGVKGYTLLELAMVIGIMAFMTSQAMPALFERAAERSVDHSVKGIGILAHAAVAYRTDERFLDAGTGQYGSWPATLGDLEGTGCGVPVVPGCHNYLGEFTGRNGFGRPYTFVLEGEALVIVSEAPEPYSRRIAFRAGPNATHVDAVPPSVDGEVRVHIPPPGQESLLAHYAMLDGSRPFVDDVTIGAGAVVLTETGDVTASGILEAASFSVTGDLTVDGDLSLTGDLTAQEIIADEIDAARFCYSTC